MADEFVEIPAADRSVKPGRRSVRLFLLGNAEDVEQTIAELHMKQLGEVAYGLNRSSSLIKINSRLASVK